MMKKLALIVTLLGVLTYLVVRAQGHNIGTRMPAYKMHTLLAEAV